jgi:serine/threonine protein kinase
VGCRFSLTRLLGSGGFFEVWAGEGPGGVPAAIKLSFSLDPEENQRRLQALKRMRTLRHPHLLQTWAYWQQEKRLVIVTELAAGSLRDRLKECREEGLTGIPPAELLVYLSEAAEALDYLHSEKVLHGDIKPENILLMQRHAKLADFGLAKLHESTQNVSASHSGTPSYMAPEMWRSQVSEHSDQYCLAVTYAELRLDRRLFAGSDMLQLMMEHMEKTPDLTPLPKAEQQVLLRALAKKPDRRYPSCSRFVQELQRAVAH